MNKTSDIIEFIISLINDFAERLNISEKQACLYLRDHGALELMEKHYGVMHTLDVKENIESLINYCRGKGGKI